MTNNLKVQGYDNLEKDPNSGAILLTQTSNVAEIRMQNMQRKIKVIEKQNEEILQLLKDIFNKLNA